MAFGVFSRLLPFSGEAGIGRREGEGVAPRRGSAWARRSGSGG